MTCGILVITVLIGLSAIHVITMLVLITELVVCGSCNYFSVAICSVFSLFLPFFLSHESFLFRIFF